MPLMNFSGSDSEEDLNEQFAEITKLLNFLLNGRLDFQNVRVKGLTAETIDVQELSAISANLGTITAGLMRAVSIYGSYIATSEGTYPRAEMSNTQNLFGAYSAPIKYIQIKALDGVTSTPSMIFNDGSLSISATFYIDPLTNDFNIGSKGKMQISAAPSDLVLNGGTVRVPSWDQVVNNATGQTLYDALLSGPV